MSKQYSVTIKNESQNAWDLCVYQHYDKEDTTGILVWLCKRCNPGTSVCFSWDDTYCFFWCEKGEFCQSVDAGFSSREFREADPADTARNSVNLSCADGAYKFTDPSGPEEGGKLYLHVDGMVPPGKVSAGFGMSDCPVYAVSAAPNMFYCFSLPEKYGVTFGNTKQGEYMDKAMADRGRSFTFPPGVNDLYVTLKEDNTWSDVSY